MSSDRKPQMARMPWYPRDFASSTREWSVTARGVYRELLDAQWDGGDLPAEEHELRMMIRATQAEWRKAWPVVERKFPVVNGRRRNARLDEHRGKALEEYERRRAGANNTNAKRRAQSS